ncbi:MAG: aldo/keto reductase [Alphaproteobacteria bacterium]
MTELRRLGASGLLVSPLSLGTMLFGLRTSERDAARLLALARDAGVNFLDTADMYVQGRSEEVIGRLVRRGRDGWVIATKVGGPFDSDPSHRGLGRRWIMRQIDASLRRLGTDYVDIYYFHQDDLDTPIEESVAAMADIIRQGKARYFGISNYRAWRLSLLVALCERAGAPKPIVCQPYYNAMNRMPEVEELPACRHFGLGVVPYSPVARGVLTGKYRWAGAAPRNSRRARQDKRFLETEWRRESLELAGRIKTHAERRGMTAAQFAVLWVLNNSIVTSVICGPRTVEQWREYLGALERRFTAEDEAFIDKLVPRGHPSTPGYSDPQYPITGRAPRTG